MGTSSFTEGAFGPVPDAVAEAPSLYGFPSGGVEDVPEGSRLQYVTLCAAVVIGCSAANWAPVVCVPHATHLVGKAEELSAADNSCLRYQLDTSLDRMQDSRPIWEVFSEILRDVSREEFAKLPRDGAAEHDRYLYGQATQE